MSGAVVGSGGAAARGVGALQQNRQLAHGQTGHIAHQFILQHQNT